MFPNLRRPAYSVIEFVVIVAIFTLLVGMLLPAIQKMRAAASRYACSSHLKEIAIGILTYHDVQGHLPQGGKNGCDSPRHPSRSKTCVLDYTQLPFTSDQGTPPEQRSEWSWTYKILPYIHQNELFIEPSHDLVRKAPIPIYFCPARRSPQSFQNLAKGDYAGNSGTSLDRNLLTGVITPTGTRYVKLEDITDGLAQTVLVGEKRMKRDRFFVTLDDNESYYSPGWDVEVVRAAIPDLDTGLNCGPNPDITRTLQPPFMDLNSGLNQFGSSHVLGTNLAVCDGSVRHIRFRPDRTIFQRYCDKADGLTIHQD